MYIWYDLYEVYAYEKWKYERKKTDGKINTIILLLIKN